MYIHVFIYPTILTPLKLISESHTHAHEASKHQIRSIILLFKQLRLDFRNILNSLISWHEFLNKKLLMVRYLFLKLWNKPCTCLMHLCAYLIVLYALNLSKTEDCALPPYYRWFLLIFGTKDDSLGFNRPPLSRDCRQLEHWCENMPPCRLSLALTGSFPCSVQLMC